MVVVGAIDATFFDEIEASHDRLIAASKPRWFLARARPGAATQGETAAQWSAVLLGASPGFSGQTANLVAVAAGEATIVDDVHGGAEMRRSVLFALAARLAAIDVSEHPGRVRAGRWRSRRWSTTSRAPRSTTSTPRASSARSRSRA